MSDAIERGMRAQMARLRASGDRRIGWKVGFNDPAAQRRFGLAGTIVGHLLAGRVVESGASYTLPPGARGMVEVEIALLMGADVAPGATLDQAEAAIVRLVPALEIVDFSRPADSVEAILGHDVFHEAVVFGGPGRSGASLTGVTARGTKNGDPAGTGDLGLVPAELGEVPLRIAQLVAPYGEGVRAGDRIIAGALFPPIPVAAGDEIRAEIPPLGRVAVRIA
jgi:2-oxo-hept-3-ene-1,7-dioate hydratase